MPEPTATLAAALRGTFTTEHLTQLHDDAANEQDSVTHTEPWGTLVDALFLAAYPRNTEPTHVEPLPDQPDGIEDDSRDLPDPVVAAERLREYIRATGDGLYDIQDGAPLYARDLEAVTRATLAQDTYKRERDEALQDLQSVTDDLEAVRTERDQIDAELATERREHGITDTALRLADAYAAQAALHPDERQTAANFLSAYIRLCGSRLPNDHPVHALVGKLTAPTTT